MVEGFNKLPADLPVPLDDGASSQLLEKSLPNVVLYSTSGK